MEILNIKLKNKKNANIFSVLTNTGEYEMHSDIIVKNNIKLGEIEDKAFYSSVNESERVIGFNDAVKYVSSKLKTQKQIKDYLLKKGYHINAVNDIVKKLKEYNIVDDSAFAKSYINSNPNFSKTKLKQKLYSFGVKEDNFTENLNEVDDFVSCQKHAIKYLKNKPMDKQTIEKLIRRLTSLGYNWDTINSTLKTLNLSIED